LTPQVVVYPTCALLMQTSGKPEVWWHPCR
jgi:hypothetical protein